MSRLKVYNLATGLWEYAAAVAPVSVGPSAPPSPVDGQLWWDNDDDSLIPSTIDLTSAAEDPAFTGKYAPRMIGTGVPAGVGVNGERYYDSTAKREYMSDGVGWVIMSEPEQSFTPTWTNVTVGDGTRVGYFHRSDGYVDFWAQFLLGSTSAMGTGPVLTLPFSPKNGELTFTGSASQVGVARIPLLSEFVTGTTFQLRVANTNAQITASVPFTWANTHAIFAHGRYQMSTRYL